MIRFFVLAALMFLFCATDGARAFADDEKTYVLDGEIYTKANIINDFLNVAFTERNWNSDLGKEKQKELLDSYFSASPNPSINLHNLGEISEGSVPWLAPHIGEKLNQPLNSRNVLSKWDHDRIYVGIDWPRYVTAEANYFIGTWYTYSGYPENAATPFSIKGAEQHYSLFLEAIKDQVYRISESTGREIGIVEPWNPQDISVNHAKIRIVPSYGLHPRNFKNFFEYGHTFSPEDLEPVLFNGVLFESYTDTYFDGYLLPKKDLSLDISICKIDPSLPPEFFIPLLNECLIRTLGLPGMSVSHNSLLSRWHSPPGQNKVWSKLIFSYNDEEFRSYIFSDQSLNLRHHYSDSPKQPAQNYYGAEKIFELDPSQMNRFRNLPAYDLVMLSLLYCPALKSGMTPEEARGVLEKSEACFQFLERIAAKPSPVSDD